MTPSRPPALVISLDFELRWGVHDHCPPRGHYERNLLGARQAVPRLLATFEEFEVAATWATVGFLFAHTRKEAAAWWPPLAPTYLDRKLLLDEREIGDNESKDPLHYAGSLVDAIQVAPRQELATHTFAHYLCNEPGQTAVQFTADLKAARAAASARGIVLRSIVFPRNQHNPAYDGLLLSNGIETYRGNPDNWMWRFGDAAESATRGRRAARLADAYFELSGDGSIGWEDVVQPSGLADLRASHVLRPYSRIAGSLEELRLRRLQESMRSTARRCRIVHLWCHPHNFGLHQDQNFSFLRRLLETFADCRTRYGMESLTMAEVGERAGVLGQSRRTWPNVQTREAAQSIASADDAVAGASS